jgi:hypothetical protein
MSVLGNSEYERTNSQTCELWALAVMYQAYKMNVKINIIVAAVFIQTHVEMYNCSILLLKLYMLNWIPRQYTHQYAKQSNPNNFS